MAVGRRYPPNIPSIQALSENPGRHLHELWRYIRDSVSGHPAPHAETHSPDADADPLTVGTPVSIGMTNTEGDDDSFSRSDHVHATPLTTKGDLLTVSGGVLAKLGVGTDTHVLTADSAQTAGFKWASTAAVAHEVLSATHSDTLTGTVVRGDVIVGNSTPKWLRLGIGTTGKVLHSDGTDPSWQALVFGDLPTTITAAPYVTVGGDANLTGERALTGTANQITVTDNGANATVVLATPQNIDTSATPQFARLGLGAAADGTALLRLLNGSQFFETANGSTMTFSHTTEEIVIAAAAQTDSAATLLPASSITLGVTVRVTVAIPTAATFTVGANVIGGTTKYEATGISTAANTTAVCTDQWDGGVATDPAGPSNNTARRIRIIPNLTPANNTGRVRCDVFSLVFTPPTS